MAEDTLLGASLLLIAPRPANRRVKAMGIKRLLQRLSRHDMHMNLAAMIYRVDPACQAFGVGVNN